MNGGSRAGDDGSLPRLRSDVAHWPLLAILATGIVPVEAPVQLELDGSLERDEHGFLAPEQPLPGLMGAGCAKRPVEVSASVRDATGAALKALQSCVE